MTVIKLTEAQKKTLEKHPNEQIEIRHVIMPIDDYEPYSGRRNKKFAGKKFVNVYINPEGRFTLHEGGYFEMPVLHRRWRVPDDSVYGYSPAAMLGLVDARVLQSQARVILDAGELAVAPPLLARRDAIMGGVNNYAGAVTWVDMEYDERFGEAIRALDNQGQVKIGLEMKVDTRNILMAAFYLNKLNLPSDKDMTAYEVSERIAEYIRSAGPVFEPFEADNARILDAMFTMSLRLGYFGPIETIPPELRGGEIKWEFDTPVQSAYKRVKVVRARETAEAVAPLMQIDPTAGMVVDWRQMARDTVENIGGEAAWRVPEEEVLKQIQAKQDAAAEQADAMKQDAMLGMADKAASAGQKAAKAAEVVPGLAQQLQQLLMGGGQPQQPQEPSIDDLFPSAAENPFGEFGLDPSAVDGLTDDAANFIDQVAG